MAILPPVTMDTASFPKSCHEKAILLNQNSFYLHLTPGEEVLIVENAS